MNHMLLCGRIVLVAKFPAESDPEILAHTDCVLEAPTFEYLLAMDPLFTESLCDVQNLLRSSRCASIPKNFGSSVKSTWISEDLHLETHSLHALISPMKQRTLFHLVFRLLVELTVDLFVPEHALFTEFASRFRCVIFDLREDAKIHTTDSYSVL